MFTCEKYTGNVRYWTRDLVIERLKMASKKIKGDLPHKDSDYSRIKKGRLDWPPAVRVLEYFGSMARGWMAAGVDPKRVTLSNIDWTKEEEEYLLDYAGKKTLKDIAKHLHRSYPAIRSRLNKNYGIASRHNQGYMSAAELAKEYNCSCHRIRTALQQGKIKGRFDQKRNRWEIDPVDVMMSPSAQIILHKSKMTYKTFPTDLGDYCRRYGLKRTLREGRIVYVKAM